MNSSAARASGPNEIVTLAPAPSGAGAEILVVTEDDFFLLAVRRVVMLPNRVWHATSDAQAADMLVSTPCAVAVLDVGLMPAQLSSVVARLREQFPDLALVIAGEPAEQAVADPFLASGQAESFIAKPQAARQLAKALEAGVNRHFDLKSETARRDAATASRKRLPVLIGGIAAAIVLTAVVAIGAWIFLSRDTTQVAAPSDTSAADQAQASSSERIELALQQARESFEDGRYFDPKSSGESKKGGALDHYRTVLALDPANAEAKDGLNRIAEVMLARAEAALIDDKPREAISAIKTAKSIEPNHPRVAFLETQVARALDRTVAAQEEVARAAELSHKVAALVKRGNERLTQDRLIEPANDNAKFYFTSARELDRDSALTQQALRQLVTRMLQKTNQSATKGEFEAAERWLAQAKLIEVGATDIARAERDLRAVQERGKLAEAERQKALQEQLAAEKAAQDPVNIERTREEIRQKRQAELLGKPKAVSQADILKQAYLEYPQRAQREGIEGVVDLNFTFTAAGEVKDIVVVNAEPKGHFEDAAQRAVKRMKFKPYEIDGETYDRRLSLRLRFKLDK